MTSQHQFFKLASAGIAGIAFTLLLSVAPAKSQDNTNSSSEETRLIQSLKGPVLYQAYCATCHGKDAKGNGPAVSALKVRPADLTHLAKRNGGKFPLDRVQKTISGDAPGTPAHGAREMPIWGPIFGQIAWDQDLGKVRIYNLSKYIESLQVK
jgi:mono/diheme cytochrome c family protein